MKTTNPSTRNSMSRSLPLITSLPRRSFSEGGSLITYHYPATPKPTEGGSLLTVLPAVAGRALFLIPLVLACFALSPAVQAVNPPPDGAYPGANTAEGQNALQSLTSGIWNTALGYQTLYHDTTGHHNTASGAQALFSNTTGFTNTAEGFRALYLNTTGYQNTASGPQALYNNTTGFGNTAVGFDALFSNTTASFNTANGYFALYHNTTGQDNTATGSQALLHNTTGYSNTANGYQALNNNTIGYENNAFGFGALASNATSDNSAFGVQALSNNTTGDSNVAFGNRALFRNIDGYQNDAFGRTALYDNVSGHRNTAIGHLAGFNIDGNGNVCIGAQVVGEAGVNDSTYIRNVNTTLQPIAAGMVDYVTVDLATAKLGHDVSSRRYKEDIRPMDKASEALYQLKPVTYRYKKDIDPSQNLDYGLVAEDVAKINPELAIRDGNGQVESVRYKAINAMLLNEFLKEHRKVQMQEAIITQLKKEFQMVSARQEKEIQLLSASLKEQAWQIQKVSAQLEVRKPAPQMAGND